MKKKKKEEEEEEEEEEVEDSAIRTATSVSKYIWKLFWLYTQISLYRASKDIYPVIFWLQYFIVYNK